MSRYKQYPAYKKSKIKWLDNIPTMWKIVPVRYIVNNINEKNENAKEQNYLSLMANKGVIKYKDKGNVGNKKPDDLRKCKLVQKGDIVINSMNFGIGAFGVSPYNGICSPVYIVLRINKQYILPGYAKRLFENQIFQKYIASFGNGILSHRAAISWDDLKSAYLPLPPIKEQKKIADFLDKETARIDALIEEKQKMLDLLEEKRTALISQVVTRGIDPKVEMKPSEVEWLGEIPKDWKKYKLKYLTKEPLKYGINEKALHSNRDEPRYIRITDIDGAGNLKEDTYLSLPLEIAKEYLLEDGDILFARSGATVGKSFIYKKSWGIACYAGYLIRFRSNKNLLLPEFLYYYSLSNLYWSQINNNTIQATIQNFNAEKYAELLIFLPPLQEQKNIIKEIDNLNKKINQLISNIQSSVKLLQERRTALITATITGQLDIA